MIFNLSPIRKEGNKIHMCTGDCFSVSSGGKKKKNEVCVLGLKTCDLQISFLNAK